MTVVLVWTGIGLLGAIGSYGRFALGAAVTARHTTDFPLGTFVVNLTGGWALGLLTGLAVTGDDLLLLGTGLLGGYTTFSTWMAEAQRLGEDAAWATMGLYLVGSMVGGVLTTGLGWLVGGAIG
jgi:CrcB protein